MKEINIQMQAYMSASNIIEISFLSEKRVSLCDTGACVHPRAWKWLQCEICEVWLHNLCAGVSVSTSQKADYRFVCVGCSSDCSR